MVRKSRNRNRKESHKHNKYFLPFSQTRKKHQKKSQKTSRRKSMRRKSMRRKSRRGVSKVPLETGGNWFQVALRRMIKQPHRTRKSPLTHELKTFT